MFKIVTVHNQLKLGYFYTFNVMFISFICAGALAFSNAYFGQGIGPMIFSDVNCVGTEDRLNDCPHHRLQSSEIHLCRHGEDAGVRCVG